MEKKRGIGASITIAVSSSGFTDPAMKKASMSGIDVRTLAEASAEDFIQWLRMQNVVLDFTGWSFAGLALELYDAPEDAEVIPASLQSFRERGPLAPIFISNSDGRRFHVENILIEWKKRNRIFFPADLPADGTKVRRTLHQPLERNSLHIETTKGKFDIRAIHIALSFSRSIKLVPVSRLTEYSDPFSPLVQTAEWNLTDNITLSLHRDLQSAETTVTITPKDET